MLITRLLERPVPIRQHIRPIYWTTPYAGIFRDTLAEAEVALMYVPLRSILLSEPHVHLNRVRLRASNLILLIGGVALRLLRRLHLTNKDGDTTRPFMNVRFAGPHLVLILVRLLILLL